MGKSKEAWRNRIVGHGQESPEQLLANPANWRVHPKSQQDALAGVLNEVGWVQDIIVNQQTGHVVDGHLRVSLAISKREPSVPVVYVDLDPAEEALVLATLDPLSAMAATDKEQLDSLLREVQSGEAGVQAMLAELAERAGLDYGKEPKADPGAQVDRAAELQEKWGVKRGDVWSVGRHRLMCGDSTSAEDVARLMDGKQADCVFTSPPYAVGVDYGEYEDTIASLRALLPAVSKRWLEVVVPGGFAVVNFGDIASGRNVAGSAEPCEYPMTLDYWPVFRADGWLLWSRRIWCKPNPRVHSPWCIQSNRAATDWEHLWTWRKPGEPILKRVDGEMRSALGWIDTSLMHGVDVGKEVHGAGMALGIAQWMLLVHSRDGAIVHEPFVGTGTTVAAAEQLGRTCYGMELSPEFCAISLERLAGMGLEPVLL